MATVNVRYIVDDVDATIAFYGEQLGFEVDMHPAPGFAVLSRGDLRLMVNAPGGGGGAGQPMPDGRVPEPGLSGTVGVGVIMNMPVSVCHQVSMIGQRSLPITR